MTVPEVPSRCIALEIKPGAVLGGEAAHVRLDLGGHRLVDRMIDLDAAIALGERHDARAAARPSRESAAPAARRPPACCARAARFRTSRRRYRTGSRPRRRGPSAACSRSRPVRLRSRGRRSRGRARPRAARGREIPCRFRPSGRPRWRSAARASTLRLRILSRQIDSASIARSIAASPSRPRGRHALAEPDDARKRVDDAKTLARRARDQQPAVVGAEIERRVGGARVVADYPPPSGRGWRGGQRRPHGGRPRGSRRCAGSRPDGVRASSSINFTVLPRRSFPKARRPRPVLCPRSKKSVTALKPDARVGR